MNANGDETPLTVVRIGHPVLRQHAQAISDPAAPEVRRLADAMIDAMLAAPGVGLAAPQVGQKLRLIVMRLMEARTPDAAAAPIRAMALVNPEFEALSPELELGWEGCLSVPELRGMVPRYRRIRYRGWLPGGEPVEAEAEGFQARIIQHEIDHLDGIVYLDRMTDLSTLGFGPELLAASAGSRP